MEEKIHEIIKKRHWYCELNTQRSTKDITKEIASMMTEFIEWMTKEEAFYGNLSEKYYLMTTENKKFSTIEELFQYWLNKSNNYHERS